MIFLPLKFWNFLYLCIDNLMKISVNATLHFMVFYRRLKAFGNFCLRWSCLYRPCLTSELYWDSLHSFTPSSACLFLDTWNNKEPWMIWSISKLSDEACSCYLGKWKFTFFITHHPFWILFSYYDACSSKAYDFGRMEWCFRIADDTATLLQSELQKPTEWKLWISNPGDYLFYQLHYYQLYDRH